MTKLSERMPDIFGFGASKWLKELAEYVEFIDRRGQTESCSPYEPQSYDEAIALVKGWKHYIDVNGLLCWENPSGSRVHLCPHSWEDRRWPELWKEMVEALHRGSMYLYESEWTFNLPAHQRYRDSTPGRVVCKAYLVYKGHVDWAKRLSKND